MLRDMTGFSTLPICVCKSSAFWKPTKGGQCSRGVCMRHKAAKLSGIASSFPSPLWLRARCIVFSQVCVVMACSVTACTRDQWYQPRWSWAAQIAMTNFVAAQKLQTPPCTP